VFLYGLITTQKENIPRTKILLPWTPGFVVKNTLAAGWVFKIGSSVRPLHPCLMIPETTHWHSLSEAARHVLTWSSLHSSSSSRIATQQSSNAAYAAMMPVFQLMITNGTVNYLNRLRSYDKLYQSKSHLPVPEFCLVRAFDIRRTLLRKADEKLSLTFT